MQLWQSILIFVISLYSCFGAYRAYIQCRYLKRAYTLTPAYFFLGAFVWADVLIFGLFWALIGIASLYLQDWLLYLVCIAAFWLVRSIGETIYWFLQQFSTIHRNPPESLPGYKYVQSDAIWFVYQIIAQCITVVSLVALAMLIPLWLTSLGILGG